MTDETPSADEQEDPEPFEDPSMTLWVKHPPRRPPEPGEDWTELRLVVDGNEAFSDLRPAVDGNDASLHGKRNLSLFMLHISVSNNIEKFKETGDPYYAISAFRMCHFAGLYPPRTVLDWLDKAFNEYFESDGEKDLMALLGLKPGKRRNPIKDRKTLHRRRWQAEQAHMLVVIFDISSFEAAEMVHYRDRERGEETSSAAWIDEDYRKNWRKELIGHDWMMGGFWTDERKRDLLATYPRWCIPSRLKRWFEPGVETRL